MAEIGDRVAKKGGCIMEISEGHKEAAVRIMADAYPYGWSLEELFENMIEDYLLREHGRLGKMSGDNYIEA